MTSAGVTEDPTTKYSNLVGYIGAPTLFPKLNIALIRFLRRINLFLAADISPSQRLGTISVMGHTSTLLFY